MAQKTLADRVEIIERNVTSLEKLPARMDALELQILQFRDEVRVEFSAVRTEIKAGDEQTCLEIRALGETLRREMRETNTHMRVLHEDVISRIALLGESRNGRRRKKDST